MGRGRRRPVLQVASNLVENALRETPAGGAVTVRAEPALLVVADTGPGLDADDLAHAFDRFFLYDKYGRERPVGSGLGLAIVKQLADGDGRRRRASSRARAPARRSSSCCRQGRSREVSTTSKSAPVRRPSACRSSFDQRGSGAPLMYHGEPLSARIIP